MGAMPIVTPYHFDEKIYGWSISPQQPLLSDVRKNTGAKNAALFLGEPLAFMYTSHSLGATKEKRCT